MKRFDALRVLEHRVGHDLRAQHVGLEEVVVVVDRSRDVRLGREVHDDIGFGDQRIDERRVAHVAVPELEPAVVDLVERRRAGSRRCRRRSAGRGPGCGSPGNCSYRYRTKLLPMNPAPPVTRIVLTRSLSRCRSRCASVRSSTDRDSSPQLSNKSIADRYGTNSPCSCG